MEQSSGHADQRSGLLAGCIDDRCRVARRRLRRTLEDTGDLPLKVAQLGLHGTDRARCDNIAPRLSRIAARHIGVDLQSSRPFLGTTRLALGLSGLALQEIGTLLSLIGGTLRLLLLYLRP